MNAIGSDTIVGRRRDLLMQNMDGAVVMADLKTGDYYGLESTAGYIWQLLEQPRTLSELCGLLQHSYEIDPLTCEADVVNFLNDLLSRFLIEILECPAGE